MICLCLEVIGQISWFFLQLSSCLLLWKFISASRCFACILLLLSARCFCTLFVTATSNYNVRSKFFLLVLISSFNDWRAKFGLKSSFEILLTVVLIISSFILLFYWDVERIMGLTVVYGFEFLICSFDSQNILDKLAVVLPSCIFTAASGSFLRLNLIRNKIFLTSLSILFHTCKHGHHHL